MAQAYERIGAGYRRRRRPDPRWQARIGAALADVGSVVNVGAGAGSYEPAHTAVAIDPSLTMLRQRPPGAAPAVRARAERLPLPDGAVDAALAILTVHHWTDRAGGLAELRRIARRRAVVVTWAPGCPFWLTEEYVPAILERDRELFPPIAQLVRELGGRAEIVDLLVPRDCEDGFLAAYWARPEAYLDAEVRAAMSTFAQLPPAQTEPGLVRLRADLESGAWHARWDALLAHDALDAGYRMIVADFA